MSGAFFVFAALGDRGMRTAQAVQESAEFHRNKIFQENMRYPLAKYAKIGYYIQALFCMNSRMMLKDVKNTIIWRHSDYDRR